MKKFFMLDVILKPLIKVSDNLGIFLILSSIFSFLLLICTYLSGQSFTCQFAKNIVLSGTCHEADLMYVIFIPVKMFICAVFLSLWYQAVYENKEISEKLIIQSWRSYIRVFLIMVAFLVINFIPAGVMQLLFARVPNPNWIIELIYFTFVAVWLLAPFILMRLYGLVADLIAGNGFGNLKKLWRVSSGKGLKLVLTTSVIIFICAMLLSAYVSSIRTEHFSSPMMRELVGEYFFDVLTFLSLTIIVGYMAAIRDNFLSQTVER